MNVHAIEEPFHHDDLASTSGARPVKVEFDGNRYRGSSAFRERPQ